MMKKFMNEGMKSIEFKKNNEKSKTILECLRKCIENDRDILVYLAVDGFMNLLKFLSLDVIQDREELYRIWLKGNSYSGFDSDSLLMTISHGQPVSVVKEAFDFAVETFTEPQVKELLMFENINGENILNSAIGNYKDDFVLKFVMEKLREILKVEEVETLKTPKQPFWQQSYLGKNMKTVFSRCKKTFSKHEFCAMLKTKTKNGKNLLHFACDCDYRNCEDVKTILQELVENFGIDETKEILTEKTSNDEQTALMFSAKSEKSSFVEVLWTFIESNFDLSKQIEILLEANKLGWNCFHFSTLNRSKESFQFVKKVYEEKVGIEKIKEILLKENENGENILSFAINSWKPNEEKIAALWSFMQELFDDDTMNKMLIKSNSEGEVVFKNRRTEKYEVFEPFVIKTCTDNDSTESFKIWLLVAELFSLQFIQQLCSIVDQKSNEFSTSFYTKLFKFQNLKNEDIWQCASRNGDNERIVNFFREKGNVL
jgi:hypothetical protein